MTDDIADILADLAPSGTLRAAINFGNPVLAQRDPKTGEPGGVSADLARELARRCGLPLDFVAFETAGSVADGATTDAWDVAFLADDPMRAATIAFSPPYVLIEGTYLVPSDSPLRTVEEVDRAGVRIAVGRNSAYDLFLTREIKSAQLVRWDGSAAALDGCLQEGLDAAAGVRQPLVAFAAAHPNLRVMEESFMVIRQAMAVPKGRDVAQRYVCRFIEEMKATGFVAAALARSGQADARVAPAASDDRASDGVAQR